MVAVRPVTQAFSGNYQDFAGIIAIERRFSAAAEIDALEAPCRTISGPEFGMVSPDPQRSPENRSRRNSPLGWTREGRIVDANAIKEPERPCRGLDRLQDKRLTLPSNGNSVAFQLKPLRQFHELAAFNAYYFSNFIAFPLLVLKASRMTNHSKGWRPSSNQCTRRAGGCVSEGKRLVLRNGPR